MWPFFTEYSAHGTIVRRLSIRTPMQKGLEMYVPSIITQTPI